MSETKPTIKLPLKGDPYGMYIFDADGQMFAEIRGWGHLQYSGEENAIQEQIARQAFVVQACNEREDLEYQIRDQQKTISELSAASIVDGERITALEAELREWADALNPAAGRIQDPPLERVREQFWRGLLNAQETSRELYRVRQQLAEARQTDELDKCR